jgi:hypothetical protein
MKYGRIALVTLITLAATRAHADEPSDFSKYFDLKLTQIESSSLGPLGTVDQNDPALQDINFDISPSISFGINTVLSLSIAPEIDFVFVKDTDIPE